MKKTLRLKAISACAAAAILAAGAIRATTPLQAAAGASRGQIGKRWVRQHGQAARQMPHTQERAGREPRWRHEHQDGQERLVTFPHWTGSFSRDGVNYPYTMVGTDPGRGSATTTVKVVLIPMRILYPDGSVIDTSTDLVDGVTPVQATLQSPIFKPYDFVTGGHHLGPTQWIDAFQRATFWPEVSTRARNYHVNLTPVVAPTVTIDVPYEDWWILCDDAACTTYENALDYEMLKSQAKGLFEGMGLRPDVVPSFISGPAVLVRPSVGDFAFGFTTIEPPATVQPGMGPFVWIVTDYFSKDGPFGLYSDVEGLAHELLHWVTNPYFTNEAPPSVGTHISGGWCLDDSFNVPDPIEFTSSPRVLADTALPYHFPDGVLPEWYSRARRGSAVNGAYNFWGDITTPAGACVDDTPIDYDNFDATPDAIFTYAYDINDRGDVVGLYYDSDSQPHGYLRRNERTTEIQRPGALWTLPAFISNDGTITGYYREGTAIHGFVTTGWMFRTIDVPGATSTFPSGINRWGDIAGAYNDAAGVQHGFTYRAGVFKTVDVPGAAQTSINALNDEGHFAVTTYDASGAQTGAYLKTEFGLTPFSFPGGTHANGAYTLDNRDRIAGGFKVDGGTVEDGYIVRGDGSYLRLFQSAVSGMNNVGQVVGTRHGHGFVARIPAR